MKVTMELTQDKNMLPELKMNGITGWPNGVWSCWRTPSWLQIYLQR